MTLQPPHLQWDNRPCFLFSCLTRELIHLLLGLCRGQSPNRSPRSVASVLGNLTGESLGAGVLSPVRDRPGDVFTPMSLSTDFRVPGKLKAKIWTHEYFDFGLLLTNSPIEQQYELSFATSKDSGSTGLATLCLEPTNKPKPISTIEPWTNAFQIYVGVYTSKFPQEAPALMK